MPSVSMSGMQQAETESNNISDKTAVALITIDNYEEVKDGMEDIKHPLLVAVVDRKLKALALQVEGILRKFEKDRYLFLLAQDKVELLKSKKFDILNQIRELDMGNKIPVTLSIGIGINGNSLAQQMEYARAAIDLALGRGGDQALIKDKDEYLFYGGKSKEVGTNTRVRTRVKANALSELIDESTNVIVMGHKKPDLDCLGSAIGVYKIATSQGKPCNIILNEISMSIETLYARLIEQREYKEEVFISTKEALRYISEKTLLIIVDTHRPSLLESKEVVERATRTVVFDHHRRSAEGINNPVLVYHEPAASSTSELITEMIQSLGRIKLGNLEADALLAGITVDTKNFAFKTGTKTFEASAFLRRCGADTIRVKTLFQLNMEMYKVKALTVGNAEIFNNNIAISVCPENTKNAALVAAQASDELLNISGIVASYVLCTENSNVLISARSLGDVNVQRIMEKMGGGGHQSVAGVQFVDKDIHEVMEMLKDVLKAEVE